ncbi:A24 family peptidase [bacterium]|nr:A24 family peptidase [bacterium]MDA7925321.1 A24 family peptidase [Mariniblastus sp.]MDB4386348.1 A24 family peptidase [bacterium]MDB4483642.1 A24 family peptidase [bacterium]
MPSDLPTWLQLPVLMFAGLAIGVFINWAIYSWAMFLQRPISPWMTPAEGASARFWTDRIPILGWLSRRRDSEIFGKHFWVRPMVIELACLLGVPFFYHWLIDGGLTNQVILPVGWESVCGIWFYAYGILLVLMCIGTFIDFDEKTIPDEVTVTGTIIALLFAGLSPAFRLPVLDNGGALTGLQSIHYASPNSLGSSHLGTPAMLVAMLILLIWIWALMPKLPVWYVGLRKSMRFMWAHAVRPKRKTICPLRTVNRKTPPITLLLAGLLVVGLAAIAIAWQVLPESNLVSLYSAFLGMAFGGGLVWAIRIIGTIALQKEAMGFGDVTLHAMIGAFLGWQAALLVFVMAPFAALLVVLIQFIVTRQSEIAFGPYLSAGALILLVTWGRMWPVVSESVFRLGPVLLMILAGALVLMALMLVTLGFIKGRLYGDELVDP